jgi:hypothetical protein
MTEPDRIIAPELAAPRLSEAGLDVGRADVTIALVTFVGSLAVLVYSMSAVARFEYALLLHLAVVAGPALFWTLRARRNGELTVPVLLTVATFATGPVGALGCAGMALALWRQRPSPTRLQDWYDYIAGVVARSRMTRIYDELISGRLPRDPAAAVPRFRPILQGASVEEQQDVLGVLGRRYHPDFRAALRNALRNKNGFIRAQAAAVASRLDIDEKTRLWSAAPARSASGSGQGAGPPGGSALDVEAPRS